MHNTPNRFLITAGILSAIAALLHLGCIIFGAPWYRFLGAGEQMAQMAAIGHWYPTITTLIISSVLSVWSLYAFAGAGVIGRLPFMRFVLCSTTVVFLLRGVAFAPLMTVFPGNSSTFWMVSSTTCLVLGIIYLIGLRQVWPRL